jgi:[ribosomal protein S5]-alanine N-acetyltransferase
MVPVLTTERLVLRGVVPADAPALYVFRSDPVEQRHNDEPLTRPEQADELVERLARMARDDGSQYWGVTLKGDDTVVGLMGYNEIVAEHARAAVGYDLKRSLWGQGLASEAMRAVLDHGFGTLGLNRVEAHTNDGNHESVRMLRRLGFWREGTFHERFREGDAFVDVALFVMLARDRVPRDVHGPVT